MREMTPQEVPRDDEELLAKVKQQLRVGNAEMRDTARSRGYRLHPRLAVSKTNS